MVEKKHGGRRAGAGRKSKDGAEWVVVITTYLDQEGADLVEEYGGGSVGIRMALRELAQLKSQPIAKARGRTAVGTTLPILPKLRVVPERNEDGVRYNITARMRLEREAQVEFEAAMLAYRKQTGQA